MFHPVRTISFRAVLLFLLASGVGVYPQTSIDDVHVFPRETGIEMATATAGPRLSGAGLIRTSTELVMVPVTITDDRNRPVTGLARDNFQLFENKQAQEIKNFSSEDSPVSIGIIMDVSGSMANKLERARDAVHQFCEASNPQDEFFMVTFSDAPRLATDFTDRPEEIENALLGAQSKGRTSLLDAIYMGIHKMKDARYSRRTLLIISDGGDNHSRYSDRDVKRAVKEADILIYAVGTYDRYATSQEELLGPELLQNVAGVTGGQAYTLSKVGELPEVTRAIGTRLRHQYMLTYRPQTRSRDGKWHKISVKLRLPKKWSSFLRVNARTGYYAGAE
jgi:Ca-activated chloride channel family protein